MAKRILTSVVALPVLVAFVVIGALPLKLALAAIAGIGLYELFMAVSKRIMLVHYVSFAFSLFYFLLLDTIHPMRNSVFILLILFTILIMCVLVFRHETNTVVDGAVALFGFFYVVVMLSTIYLVRMAHFGSYFVWLVFIAAWGSDTGAYFAGSYFGKHKLTPKLSPKKTVEGAIGGVVAASVIAAVYGIILSQLFDISDFNIVLGCVVTGLAGSVFSQIGDLTASAIKRFNNIKDYGKILPGHGGVLDRFDSVLFTAPAVYLMMLILRVV